ncbi:hypothetical protein [Arachidicoccus sp.]|uniref:hypothetical protein n=1 Tax=Arachidicoccus sp. TaxID=1872624 RepID=UPI003D1A8AF7
MNLKKLFLFAVYMCITCLSQYGYSQVFYAGEKPSSAKCLVSTKEVRLNNNIFSVKWFLNKNKMTAASFNDTQLKREMCFAGKDLFSVVLKDGSVLTAEEFGLAKPFKVLNLLGNPKATRLSERLNGKGVQAYLVNAKYGIRLNWNAILRDSCNYIEQTFEFTSLRKNIIRKIVLINLPLDRNIYVDGDVNGSPLIYKNMFFALEHPLSKVDTSKNFLQCFLKEERTIDTLHSFTVSSAWGVTPEGQLRRGFLYYIEHERAAPYRQFLHYNSWFDISWNDRKLNDSICADRIRTYADSLITKRHTNMNAFLFDDGWDNDKTLWGFNKGFPQGFTHLKLLANKYHAQLGVWISPWGGYDEAKEERLKYGRLQQPPFETNHNGFSLSGPHYYARFKRITENFIKSYGVAIFKFDGIGNMDDAVSVVKDEDSTKLKVARKDFEALLELTKALRTDKPNIYLSLTVGTWSSPFWLNYADVTWRSGGDNGQCGSGNERQRWLNYRDKEVYENVVLHAPLYPLNAIMNHGICIADNGLPAKYEKDDKDIADEIWSFFGTGTSLQEMYINPHLLSSKDWDCLAKAIHWSRENAFILPDVHWIGGNPGKDAIYGYAAWNQNRGVVTLRNPSNKVQVFLLDNRKIFNLPENFDPVYRFYKVNNVLVKQYYAQGDKVKITLQPFEVLVMDAVSSK